VHYLKVEYNTQYKFDDVKEIVRKKQIYILDTIVNICKRNNLVYWLDGGTLLGAVRHKGFIPWDDDIDIGLMRADYERLLTILSSELPEDLVLQSRKTDNQYKLPFVKIRDKYSKIEYEFKYNGIFIDIFAFDNMPKLNLLKKIQRALFVFLEVMMIHTNINALNISKKTGIKVFIVINAMKVISKIGTILNEKIFDVFYNAIKNISNINISDDIGDGLTASWAYYKSIRNKDVYLPVSEVMFNGKTYNAPNNTDSYLKSLYGDNYMTPINYDNIHMESVVFFNNKESNK
jgi:lipopolysaccharide cholinephosphotransferase